jgi:sec-independent protein translocase protein TatA
MFTANIMGLDGGIVLLIALVVIFGGSQLPKIARNVGSAGKEFRKAQAEAAEEDEKEAARKAATAAVTAAPPAAVVAAPVAPVATPAAPASGDSVTISKADLEALLDERLGKGSSTN